MENPEEENVTNTVQDDTAAADAAALLRKEFNRNRRIVLKNVPEITVEVNPRLWGNRILSTGHWQISEE